MSEAATGRWRAGGRPKKGRARRLRRLGRLTLASGLVVLAGPTLAPAAQAAPQIDAVELAPAQQGSTATTLAPTESHAPVEVTLTTVQPPVPTADGQVKLTGTVRNRTSSAVRGLHVVLATTGVALENRSEIDARAAAGPRPTADDGSEITDPALQQRIGTLAAGATVSFTVVAPIAKLGLPSNPDGVYALGVEAQSSESGGLGIARTFLPLRPKDSTAKPTKVATLWPLTNPPVLQAQTYVDPSSHTEEPVLTSDLTSSLGPEGRLGQLTSLGRQNAGLHLTWMIDPDLIDTVNAMTGPYQVKTGSDDLGANAACHCVQGVGGSDAAKSWLTGLQSTLSGTNKPDVVSLPYADPDIAALAHNSDARSAVGPLLPVLGSSVGLDRLQIDASHNVAWPYQGYVDTSIVSLARSMGATQVIVNGHSLQDSTNLTHTPNAARSIGGGTTAVVADGELADIFSGDLSTQAEQTAAVQRFLAETLAITRELPNQQRDIVVQPPRNLSVASAQTLVKALAAAQGGAWVQPVDLSTVVSAGASSGADTHVPAPQSYPSALRGSEFSSSQRGSLTGTQSGLSQLQRILTRPDRLREPFNAAMVRSVSTSWRADPASGSAYAGSMGNYMGTLQGAVSILPKTSDVVVPGDNASAQIAVSVENKLDQPVTRLQLKLSIIGSGYPRLKIDSAPTMDVSIPGGGTKSTVRFKVTAIANGQVPVVAELVSAQDQTQISTRAFTVSVTSISSGVIAVMAGGGLLVILAGLRLYWKRKKNAALDAATAEGPADPTAPEDQEADA